jgi:hypothetical protein
VQRRDKGWFDNNEKLISPLTTQEDDNSATLISDAHIAMEFYQFANSGNDFFELSSSTLAHIYFIKIQVKPTEYEHMDTDRRNKWDKSTMNKIQRKPKKALIEAIMKAVCVTCLLRAYECQLT